MKDLGIPTCLGPALPLAEYLDRRGRDQVRHRAVARRPYPTKSWAGRSAEMLCNY